MDYYVDVGGETKGPYTLKELAGMWREDEITMETLFCYEGLTNWYPLHFIKEKIDSQLRLDMLLEPVMEAPKESPAESPGPAETKPKETSNAPESSETKTCPFCAEKISVKAIKCKHCGSALQNAVVPQDQPAGIGKIIAVGILLVVAVLFVWGAIRSLDPTADSRNQEQDAYSMAKQFISRQYPGANSFSSFADSVVTHNGDTYRVAIVVDGVNAFNSPVRKNMAVEMTVNGDDWKLKAIAQE